MSVYIAHIEIDTLLFAYKTCTVYTQKYTFINNYTHITHMDTYVITYT